MYIYQVTTTTTTTITTTTTTTTTITTIFISAQKNIQKINTCNVKNRLKNRAQSVRNTCN